MSLGQSRAVAENQHSSYILFIAPDLRDLIEQDIRRGWKRPPHKAKSQKGKRKRLDITPSTSYRWIQVDLSLRLQSSSPPDASFLPQTTLFVPETIPQEITTYGFPETPPNGARAQIKNGPDPRWTALQEISRESRSRANASANTINRSPVVRRLSDRSSKELTNTLAVSSNTESLTQHSSVSLDVQNLPNRALRFSCADLVAISELLTNSLRFLPFKHQPPHIKSAQPSPPPMIGINPRKGSKLTFSCLALIRHIGVVEETTVPPWLRKNGQKKETYDRCELKLVGQDGSGINLILERELVTQCIRDEEDSIEASKSFESGASRDRGTSPDKGGITLGLMETMQLSGDGRALQLPRRPVVPRKGPTVDRPTGLREGDVIAITGAVLEPINPRKEDAAGNPRRLGMTRNTVAPKASKLRSGKTAPQQPAVAAATVWDGVRALLNPQSSSTCGIELCFRCEIRSPADARWRFDPALASIDDRYAQVWQLAEIWRRLKDLSAY